MTDPIPVPYGLTMTPMPDGRHIFRPADGVDVLKGGKAIHLSPPPGDLYAPPIVSTPTVWTDTSPPDIPVVPGLPIYPGDCCVTRTPDYPPIKVPEVPLPAARGLMVLALVAMWVVRKTARARTAP